jgi:hypothetical protein
VISGFIKTEYHNKIAPKQVASRYDRVKAIRWEQGSRGAKQKQLAETLHSAKTVLADADTLLQDQVAAYSQAELLKFLTAKNRYDLNPHNLASAMAGLPHMGCRQSYERCEKNLFGSSPHIHTRVFQLIEKACRKPKPRRFLVDSIQESIKTLKKADADLQSLLTSRWRDLKLAVKETTDSNAISRALPYEITERFVKRLCKPKTQADLLIAQQDQLQ